MSILFKNSIDLENQIDELLNFISQGLILYEESVADYIHDRQDSFTEKLNTIDNLEHKVDDYRRQIENTLYQQSLIPEHRGDVLGLLEAIDNLIDVAKETLYQLDIERPELPSQFNTDYLELVKKGCKGAEAVINSTRAFFTDLNAVKNDLHKVFFYEKEADKISRQLKRKIFNSKEIELSHKLHLRDFAINFDEIANVAEAIADRLSIYTIKRSNW